MKGIKAFFRLRKNHEFQKVYKQGKSNATGKTVLLYLRNEKKGINRLGITVSKKVGKSVVRHRVKRLYREAFQKLIKNLHLEGYDFVIIARKGADQLTFKEAMEDLKKLMKRGKLIK